MLIKFVEKFERYIYVTFIDLLLFLQNLYINRLNICYYGFK
jgi:hypothetical protein